MCSSDLLDGEWDGRKEDPDVRARLYYVAMTRARLTLCLARFDSSRHPLLDGLRDGPHLLRRAPADLPAPPAELARRYLRPELKQINLGFAGRSTSTQPVHAAIARLVPGSALSLRAVDGHALHRRPREIGRASWRARVWFWGFILVVAV